MPSLSISRTLALLAVSSLAFPARATTTLTVDLASALGPVTHVASGSLYGVTEKLPADGNTLIAPLHPNMFTNPAADIQQPVGDAIAVAARLAPFGARVTIRLADWFPSWPYAFSNMSDWFDKLGQTASRKQASGLDNYYGYEIWNEPDGTWKSAMAFNDFWKQTYVKLRELDPGAKIIGPSLSYYNANSLKSFLTYAKSNDCLPDIISWHELGGSNLSANFQNYRSLEQELGIGPLPISINEYSGKNRLDDEGKPGASAPMIAKFERFHVDSACISFWDPPHPGRLGTLLASDKATNGGWWFYKWYGDMSGQMVATTPPSPMDATALDGFANLDSASRSASVVFAGVNDGSVQLVIKGFQHAAVLGAKVHATVERTPFVNRSTVVNATDMLSTADLDVTGDQISVSVAGTNNNDGYRLSLSAVGGNAGGATATGGSSNTGGSAAAGANTGGNVTSTGGSGQTSLGGSLNSGGQSGAGGNTTLNNSGGARAEAGSIGNGGVPIGAGGMLASAAGGAAGAPQISGGFTSSGGGTAASSAPSSGCNCNLQPSANGRGWWLSASAIVCLLNRRARRRRRISAA